jgi:hypothetical protein
MAATVGVAFSVGAITNFVGGVFEAAGAIKDQAAAVGMGTEAFQRIKYAVEQGGGSLEDFTKASNKLNDGLATGSKSVVGALKAAGLGFQEIRGMKPEDAFLSVTDAVGKIEDPMERARVAQELFGKGALTLLPGMIEGYRDLGNGAKVMSDETINRLEAAGDAWQDLWNTITIVSGEFLSTTIKQFKDGLQSEREYWGGVKAFLTGGISGYQEYGAALETTKKTTEAKAAADAAAKAEAERLGKETAALTFRTEAQAEADKKAAEKAEEHRKQIQALTDTISGAGLAKQVKDLQEAYAKLTPAQQANLDTMLRLAAKARDLRDAGASLTPQLANLVEQNRILDDVLRSESEAVFLAYQSEQARLFILEKTTVGLPALTAKQIDHNHAMAAAVIQQGAQIQGATELNAVLAEMAYRTSVAAAEQENMAKGSGLKDLGGKLSTNILDAIKGGGSVLQAAGSTIGNYLLDPKTSGIGKAIEEGAKKLPGLLGGAISAAVPVVGALIGPAVGWLAGKISGYFGKKEYEKVRDAFIDSAGGVDVLRVAAQKAGVELDRLMSSRKKSDVDRAIQEITEAVKFQDEAMGTLNETAQRYGFTLEELGPAMARQELDKQAQQLFKDWEVLNAAGIDTVAITGKMSEAVSAYVNDAIAMGTDVPEAMRPMLEKMVASKTLLDKNGDAITDLDEAGVDFTMSMSDGFKALIDQVGKLVDAIERGLSPAIANVPDMEIRARVVPVEDNPVQGGRNTYRPAVGRDPVESYQSGTDGFRDFGTGTPVMLHGLEAVVPFDESRSVGAFATVSGAGAGPAGDLAGAAIIINAQGAFFDTPESLQRLANKVSEALTAKVSIMGRLRAAV